MEELEVFLRKIIEELKSPFDIQSARNTIKELNNFLYCTYPDIGTINVLGQDFSYFSDFHKYWSKHYKEILDLKINVEACVEVAKALHDVYKRTKGRAFCTIYETNNLSYDNICRIRL